jgi:hypothetical protein
LRTQPLTLEELFLALIQVAAHDTPSILDFLRRWWVAVRRVLCRGSSFSTTTLPVFLSRWVRRRGSVCSYGTQAAVCSAWCVRFRRVPLAVKQAQTWWLLGVLAVPLVTLLPTVLGSFVYSAIHTSGGVTLVPPQDITSSSAAAPAISVFVPTYSPWFAAAIQVWVGLGFAGFCFLLGSCLPTRPPEGLWESIGQCSLAVFGALNPRSDDPASTPSSDFFGAAAVALGHARQRARFGS